MRDDKQKPSLDRMLKQANTVLEEKMRAKGKRDGKRLHRGRRR